MISIYYVRKLKKNKELSYNNNNNNRKRQANHLGKLLLCSHSQPSEGLRLDQHLLYNGVRDFKLELTSLIAFKRVTHRL